MHFATRKAADTSLTALVERLYIGGSAEARKAAEQLLLAANLGRLADLTRVPLGALILVPAIPDLAPGEGVLSASQLADPTPAGALRALDEVVHDLASAFGDEARDASDSHGNVGVTPRHLGNRFTEYLDQTIHPRTLARHDAAVAAFTAVPALLAPLRADLEEVLGLLGFGAPATRLPLQRFTITGAASARPEARLEVPAGFKILGGGAFVDASEPGSLLTASFRDTPTSWVARAKEYTLASPAAVTITVLALHDPDDEFEVLAFVAEGPAADRPSATATVAPGFVRTGGGAELRFTGAGNHLVASHPVGDDAWTAVGRAHLQPDPAEVTAQAIGVRSRKGLTLHTRVVSSTSSRAAHPEVTVTLPGDLQLVGGGARVDTSEPGNILTASLPLDHGWRAASKDHVTASPATVTVFAIGLAVTRA